MEDRPSKLQSVNYIALRIVEPDDISRVPTMDYSLSTPTFNKHDKQEFRKGIGRSKYIRQPGTANLHFMQGSYLLVYSFQKGVNTLPGYCCWVNLIVPL